jgi:hypothetical protein
VISEYLCITFATGLTYREKCPFKGCMAFTNDTLEPSVAQIEKNTTEINGIIIIIIIY